MTLSTEVLTSNGVGHVRLLIEFPELAQDLEPVAAAAARSLILAPVERLRAGKWEPVNRSPLEFGIVILDGYLTRSVRMERSGCSELLGRGDLLHPWSSPEGDSSLPLEVEWSVLEPARVAYLDSAFSAAAARWSSIAARLSERAMRRTHDLANQLAIVCLPGLELRLYALLWHLADRFGHVTPEGAVVPVWLTHETLATLVGARRPSVTTALNRLRKRTLIGARDDGWWIVDAGPRPELARTRSTRRTGQRDR